MTKMIITKNDILSEEDRLLIVKDIQYELKHNPTPNKLKPLYQTKVDIHRKYVKIHKHWDNLFKSIYDMFILNKIGFGAFTMCWGMKQSKETINMYHTHQKPDFEGSPDLSIIYYAQNKYPKYGTYIGIGDMKEGVQNSLVVFDASIPHRAPDLPKEVLEEEDRIIIAMDYIYD